MKYKDGKPCNHPGCLNHITHPCESCGRIGGFPLDKIMPLVQEEYNKIVEKEFINGTGKGKPIGFLNK